MLVLVATYKSSLSELIERPNLEHLLKRTIRFLLRHGGNSPMIRADARALTDVYSEIFGGAPVLEDV
jgi:hypothetical protein